MLRFSSETWLPTVVFVLLSLLYATEFRGRPVFQYAALITALIVVPFLWKSFVIRQGRPHIPRAVLAGSVSALMIEWSAWVIDAVGRFIQGRRGEEGLGGLLVILIPFMTLIAVLLGAGFASLVAFVQARLWSGAPTEAGAADLMWDGGVGGAMVATLVAPFAAMIPLAFYPDGRDPGMNLMTFTAGTWLILVPVGAWIGVKVVRRRRLSSPTPQPAR